MQIRNVFEIRILEMDFTMNPDNTVFIFFLEIQQNREFEKKMRFLYKIVLILF